MYKRQILIKARSLAAAAARYSCIVSEALTEVISVKNADTPGQNKIKGVYIFREISIIQFLRIATNFSNSNIIFQSFIFLFFHNVRRDLGLS